MSVAEDAKKWYGDGEYDVDLMINMGVITLQKIIDLYNKEVLKIATIEIGDSDVVKVVHANDDHKHYTFYCPGCKTIHGFNDTWGFNNDLKKPTLQHSVLANAEYPARRCHSFIENGKIRFLSDCFHELANQTVDLEPSSI